MRQSNCRTCTQVVPSSFRQISFHENTLLTLKALDIGLVPFDKSHQKWLGQAISHITTARVIENRFVKVPFIFFVNNLSAWNEKKTKCTPCLHAHALDGT